MYKRQKENRYPSIVQPYYGVLIYDIAVAVLAGLAELHIGRAIISRAAFSGLGEVVSEMKRLIESVAPCTKATFSVG